MYRTRGRGRTSIIVPEDVPTADQPSSPEQLFVAINPFQAPKTRWWSRAARLAHEKEEYAADDVWRRDVAAEELEEAFEQGFRDALAGQSYLLPQRDPRRSRPPAPAAFIPVHESAFDDQPATFPSPPSRSSSRERPSASGPCRNPWPSLSSTEKSRLYNEAKASVQRMQGMTPEALTQHYQQTASRMQDKANDEAAPEPTRGDSQNPSMIPPPPPRPPSAPSDLGYESHGWYRPRRDRPRSWYTPRPDIFDWNNPPSSANSSPEPEYVPGEQEKPLDWPQPEKSNVEWDMSEQREQRMLAVAKLKRAASLPRMKDGRRPPMHVEAISEGEKVNTYDEREDEISEPRVEEPAAPVETSMNADDGTEDATVTIPDTFTRTKRRSRSRTRSRGSKDLKHKARVVLSPAPSPHVPSDSSQDEGASPSMVFYPGTRPSTPNLPSLEELQRGLFRSNDVGSTSASRLMAMHRLTGGTEAYDPSTSPTHPPLLAKLGRNNTVADGERNAARQFMLSRLGGRIAKEGEGEPTSGGEEYLAPSSTPKRRRRRSRRGSAGANTEVSDSDFVSTTPYAPVVPPTPLPASVVPEIRTGSWYAPDDRGRTTWTEEEKVLSRLHQEAKRRVQGIIQGADMKLEPSLASAKPSPPPSILPAATLPLPAVSTTTKSGFRDIVEDVLFTSSALVDTVSRQIYLHFLLRIPSLYFTRVTRIFEDAQLSLPDIKKMARARAEQWNPAENPAWTTTFIQQPNLKERLPRSLLIFRSNWENFIDDLMSEWQTLNIVSVLLMSAILTMLQIDAASHPITRTSALFSLICALMSLLYGCIYIIRFGTMRKMHKASSFADEAQKSTTSIWWNVWVLLAMPAVWLAWAIGVFFVCIMSFVWLSGSSNDPSTIALSPRAALGIRIALTLVFSVGLIYLMLIVRTFHRYGDPLDREWMRRVNEWSKEVLSAPQACYYPPPKIPTGKFVPRSPILKPEKRSRHDVATATTPERTRGLFEADADSNTSWNLIPLTTPSAFSRPIEPVKQHVSAGEPYQVVQLEPQVKLRLTGVARPPPWAQALEREDLNRFTIDMFNAWSGLIELRHSDHEELPLYTRVLSPDLPVVSDERLGDSAAGFVIVGDHETASVAETHSSYGDVVDAAETALPRPSAPVPDSPGSVNDGTVASSHSCSHRSFSPIEQDQSLSHFLSASLIHPSDNHIDPSAVQAVCELIALWNERYFCPRNLVASVVPLEGSLGYVINLEMRQNAGS